MSTRAERLVKPEWVSNLKPLYHQIPGICRVCTCSQEAIMETCSELTQEAGCSWAEEDLCSTCQELMEAGNSPERIRAANIYAEFGYLINVERADFDVWHIKPPVPITKQEILQEALNRR